MVALRKSCHYMFLLQLLIPLPNNPMFKSLPNDKILDWSKLKAFAEDKIKELKIIIFVWDRFENTVGRRRKCWLPVFSPFPSVFSKGF